jgi:hypothetical protein
MTSFIWIKLIICPGAGSKESIALSIAIRATTTRPPLQRNEFIGPRAVKGRADLERERKLVIPAG